MFYNVPPCGSHHLKSLNVSQMISYLDVMLEEAEKEFRVIHILFLRGKGDFFKSIITEEESQ